MTDSIKLDGFLIIRGALATETQMILNSGMSGILCSGAGWASQPEHRSSMMTDEVFVSDLEILVSTTSWTCTRSHTHVFQERKMIIGSSARIDLWCRLMLHLSCWESYHCYCISVLPSKRQSKNLGYGTLDPLIQILEYLNVCIGKAGSGRGWTVLLDIIKMVQLEKTPSSECNFPFVDKRTICRHGLDILLATRK